ncbi:hypothetical protein FKM82_003000 [Ascaphus truei]
MDTSRISLLVCSVLCSLQLVSVAWPGKQQQQRQHSSCPAPCHCEQDSMLLRVDCSDQELTTLPGNISIFTAYL